jgi:AcrR family transcriptional regulator
LRDPKESDVKEAIIRESTRLFLANGFRGTSVKEITEAAGIGRGTLYWYFKSKDEILITIFKKFENDLLDKSVEAVRNCKGDFVAKYKTFHKFTTEFARDNRDLSLAFNSLMTEMAGTHTEAEKVSKAVYEKFRLIIQDLLEEGKREGSVPKGVDPALYAYVVMASHTGMLVQWLMNGESFDVPAFVRTSRDFILKGIEKGGR